jgi:hypothetical protein
MSDGSESGLGFTMLDGIAIVMGAAVASVQVRDAVPRGLTLLGWGLVWLTFAGVALSAAGPFVMLERRFGRRPKGYPKAGDRFWAILGIPWVFTALLRPSSAFPAGSDALNLYRVCLWTGVAIASGVAVVGVWRAWAKVSPGPETGQFVRRSWTERVGLILAIAWPLQSGFVLVVAE